MPAFDLFNLFEKGCFCMPDRPALNIPTLLGTVRNGRRSDAVARLLRHCLDGRAEVADSKLIDLSDYPLPFLAERPESEENRPPELSRLMAALARADGLVIVTPEYKNSLPAVLKNALDHLPPGFLRRKPVGICTVSSGELGGANCLAHLRLVCLALGGAPIPDRLLVSKVQDKFDASGALLDRNFGEKVEKFVSEMLWYTAALSAWRDRGPDAPPRGGGPTEK